MNWLKRLIGPNIFPGAGREDTVPASGPTEHTLDECAAGTPAERGAAWASQWPLYDETVMATGVLPEGGGDR